MRNQRIGNVAVRGVVESRYRRQQASVSVKGGSSTARAASQDNCCSTNHPSGKVAASELPWRASAALPVAPAPRMTQLPVNIMVHCESRTQDNVPERSRCRRIVSAVLPNYSCPQKSQQVRRCRDTAGHPRDHGPISEQSSRLSRRSWCVYAIAHAPRRVPTSNKPPVSRSCMCQLGCPLRRNSHKPAVPNSDALSEETATSQ